LNGRNIVFDNNNREEYDIKTNINTSLTLCYQKPCLGVKIR